MKVNQLKEWSDQQLVQEFQNAANGLILQELYVRYHLKVKKYCHTIIKDKETAEDLTQDTFVKVTKHLPRLKHAQTFVSWLFQIARNLCLDHIKKQSKTKAEGLEKILELADEIIDLEDLEAKENQIKLMEVLIDDLGIEDKQMLRMKYVDKASIKVIQEQFDLSESAVKMRLARARKKVLRLYQEKRQVK